MHGIVGQSKFTKSIADLVSLIDGKSPLKDSLFEQASEYFESGDKDKVKLSALTAKFNSISQSLKTANKRTAELKKDELKKAKLKLKEESDRQEKERAKRLQNVMNVCEKIIRLSEGENWEKTQTSSARVLGTLHLLCPTDGINVLKEKQRYKPAYKSVLTMRLLDKLLADDQIVLKYIRSRYNPNRRYSALSKDLTPFHLDVAFPLITAAIFQDIGLMHPQAQKILHGEDGQADKYRVLDKETRIKLLKLNHKYTLDYLQNGLGTERYIGNSKPERDQFEAKQNQKLKLTTELLVGALNPKRGVGNLVKIPQIYASFIFSAKPDQTLFDLPKAGLLINKAAKRSSLSQVAVDSLLQILGHFPQGYGVTYISVNPDGSFSDSFEYAIVAELNPEDPFEPKCRVATKQLTFIANGPAITVSSKRNLYYPEPRKQLEKIDPERLKLILKKLASNFEERKDMELIPSHWDPHTFFQYEKMQNLWKNT